MRASAMLRKMLDRPGIIVAPGAYDCLTAKIIQRQGFPAVYMTGAGTSVAKYGYPDLGLVTMTEMVANAASIVNAVQVPVIADADTGYGEVLSVARTVREYERVGVAAIHIEDQESPKRCGHLDDKRVVPLDDMVRKIRAAVDARTNNDFIIIVRTDALAVTGWDDTMWRCEAYVKAGADMLFVEAMRTPDEVQRVARSFDLPLLYNFVETGKSPLISVPELEKIGYKLVIFPGTAIQTVCKAVSDAMQELMQKGTTAHLIDNMVSLRECFDIVGLSEMLAQDARYLPETTSNATMANASTPIGEEGSYLGSE